MSKVRISFKKLADDDPAITTKIRNNVKSTPDVGFYQVTPITNARIDAVVAMRMGERSMRHGPNRMWIKVPDLIANVHPTMINGKNYQYVHSGSVGLTPLHNGQYSKLASMGNTFIEPMTDKAAELCRHALLAISQDYLTEERWHAYLERQTKNSVRHAIMAHDEAQERLKTALYNADNLKSIRTGTLQDVAEELFHKRINTQIVIANNDYGAFISVLNKNNDHVMAINYEAKGWVIRRDKNIIKLPTDATALEVATAVATELYLGR